MLHTAAPITPPTVAWVGYDRRQVVCGDGVICCVNWNATMNIVLYSKPGCHLCDVARESLEELAAEIRFDLDEVDIRDDPEIFERYRYRIPVVWMDGSEIAEGRISAQDMATAIEHFRSTGS